MKIDLIKTAFIIMIAFLTTSCEKDKKMGWLVGVWDLKSLYVNHHDSTDAAKSQPCYRKLNFLEEDKTKGQYHVIGEPNDSCSFSGTYDLSGDAESLRLTFTASDFRPIGAYQDTDQAVNWTIEVLSKTDLIAYVSYNGYVTAMWLKKD
jgi:hypothetical protein